MIDPWRSRQPPVEWRQILAIDDIPNLASRVPARSQRFGEFLLLIRNLQIYGRHHDSLARTERETRCAQILSTPGSQAQTSFCRKRAVSPNLRWVGGRLLRRLLFLVLL